MCVLENAIAFKICSKYFIYECFHRPISPRRDHDEYDTDLPISLIVCTCQLSVEGWDKSGEIENVMDDFLKQQLLDLRHGIITNKFTYSAQDREQLKHAQKVVDPSTRLDYGSNAISKSR